MSKLVNIYLISLSLVTYFQKLIQAQHKREVRCDIFNIFTQNRKSMIMQYPTMRLTKQNVWRKS